MTPAPVLKPGDHINGVEVLSLDPTGKRACVVCPCGSTHLYSVEALIAGQVLCPARPNTKHKRDLDKINADGVPLSTPSQKV